MPPRRTSYVGPAAAEEERCELVERQSLRDERGQRGGNERRSGERGAGTGAHAAWILPVVRECREYNRSKFEGPTRKVAPSLTDSLYGSRGARAESHPVPRIQ